MTQKYYLDTSIWLDFFENRNEPNLPKGDALHSLIARDNKATLVTLDNHFKKLLDITKLKRPQDII